MSAQLKTHFFASDKGKKIYAMDSDIINGNLAMIKCWKCWKQRDRVTQMMESNHETMYGKFE